MLSRASRLLRSASSLSAFVRPPSPRLANATQPGSFAALHTEADAPVSPASWRKATRAENPDVGGLAAERKLLRRAFRQRCKKIEPEFVLS
ncbi:hypothetical protein JCM10213_001308 [Rhodosporidiobolus nylandii]